MAGQEESPFRGLVTSWPALAAMAVTMLSFLAASPRLESPRPTSGAAVIKLRGQDPEVPARLWQDPLGSVAQAKSQTDLDFLRRGMPEDRQGEKKSILVLLALIEPDSTPEQAEIRRRERYAILSALNTAGYAPVKSDRLSYVDLKYSDKTGKPIKQGQTFIPNLKEGVRIPFEWVRPMEELQEAGEHPKFHGVCVAWVYDLDAPNALHLLGSIKKQLQETLGVERCTFAITGRITSGRLSKILKDDASFEPDKIASDLKEVTLYVTNSTAPSVRKDDDASKPLPNSGLRRIYVIGTDALLLSKLVDELESRGVSTQDDELAVISEWDTMYGRSMHSGFAEAVKKKTGTHPHHVKYFSYLRGLDGKLPGKVEADEKPDKEAKGGDPAADKPTAVNGEGDAQLDYLRRLVERMRAKRKPFRAIGILGSDVYDKLLILKALRANFPESFIFTTDLDARLLQPGDTAWTRNLIVASHFGLVLDKNLQGKIPPFRSSYDSASYLGCLMAVGCPLLDGVKSQSVPDNAHKLVLKGDRTIALPVHLYEVGRYGAFELTIYNAEQDPLGARNYQRDREHFENNRWQVVAVLLCFVFLGLLLLTVSRTWQHVFRLQPTEKPDANADPTLPWRGPLFVGVVIAAPVLTGLILYAHHAADQEPFSMVEGISVWPTVIFRVFAIGLCFYYVFKTLEDLMSRDSKIRKDFDFSKDPPDAPAPSVAWLGKRFWPNFGMWFWNPDHDTEKVVDVWRQFHEFGQVSNRFYRYLLVFALNFGLFMLLRSLFDPIYFHGRGALGQLATRASLDVAGVVLVSLLIFVVDTTVLCYRFVTYLSRYGGEWPTAPLQAQLEQRGLPTTIPSTDPVHAAVCQLLKMRLIGATTRVASDLIFDPFVVLFILIVAQNPLFVTWQWSIPALSVAILSMGAALTCAIIFQRAAKEAQRKALDRLDEILLPSVGKEKDEMREKLLQIRAEIEAMDSGVFAGFTQNPVVYALLLPLGGGGGLAVLEALLPHL